MAAQLQSDCSKPITNTDRDSSYNKPLKNDGSDTNERKETKAKRNTHHLLHNDFEVVPRQRHVVIAARVVAHVAVVVRGRGVRRGGGRVERRVAHPQQAAGGAVRAGHDAGRTLQFAEMCLFRRR
jgi:hypothetical protein